MTDRVIQTNSAREFTRASVRRLRHQSELPFTGAPGNSRFEMVEPPTTAGYSPDTCFSMEPPSRYSICKLSFTDIWLLLFCAILCIVCEQNLFLKWNVYFTQCMPTAFPMCVLASERYFFPPNCCNFAVECDWNSDISQNVQNLEISGKIDGILQENLEFFSKSLNVAFFCRMRIKWYYFLKMSFPP